jgi:hypothetical protein
MGSRTSRRKFLQLAGAAGAAAVSGRRLRAFSPLAKAGPITLLNEFGYGDVQLAACPQQQQFEQTQAVLMQLGEDSAGEWTMNISGGSLRLLPFQAIGETEYSTYFKVV